MQVHRRTELDNLLARHGTRGQAEFFLRSRGRDLGEVVQRDAAGKQHTKGTFTRKRDADAWERGQQVLLDGFEHRW